MKASEDAFGGYTTKTTKSPKNSEIFVPFVVITWGETPHQAWLSERDRSYRRA